MLPPAILEVKNLVIRFETPEATIHAVNGVSFDLREGETLGIVGESGCGKSVTMMSLLGLIPLPPGRVEAGEALLDGRDLLQMRDHEMRHVRGAQVGMVFQDPMTSLNPVLTIGRQLTEPLEIHRGMGKTEARNRAIELIKLVGIPAAEARLTDYPHQFSGGMRQRVMIAMALACLPRVLIADEPTTALDVTIQAQIVSLVKRLRRELGMAVIWITHDLGVIAGLADRVIVMYAGAIVEEASVDELYANPQHPYTLGLLGSLPRIDSNLENLTNIEGAPPDLTSPPAGCPFAPRCGYALERCWQDDPRLIRLNQSHRVACWYDVRQGKPRDER